MRRIRKNDMVIISAGKDKGKKGKVIAYFPEKNAVLVEQANLVKKHQRPNQKNPTGGITEIEAPINISNVMLLDGKTGKGTRFRVSEDKNGSKVRVAIKSGTVFD
jgi:large subunit ribosomal protein L24